MKNLYWKYAKGEGFDVCKEWLSDWYVYFGVTFFDWFVFAQAWGDVASNNTKTETCKALLKASNIREQSVILVFSVELPEKFHIISVASNEPFKHPFGC